MRAVQAYLRIGERDLCAFKNEFDLLVWKLSAVRNRKLGFETVLYTVEDDREYLEAAGLAELYDEVHYEPRRKLDGVDLTRFGAAIKFVALEEELRKGTDFFMVDTDLVFTNDEIKSALAENDCLFWLNAEPLSRYVDLATMRVPPRFKYPRWVNPKLRPFNTAIIYCEDKRPLKDWVDLAWGFMIGHPVKEDMAQMITVEQRFIHSALAKYGITPKFFCSIYRGQGNYSNPFDVKDKNNTNFGDSHFHIGGTKVPVNMVDRFRKSWIKTLLMYIRQEDEGVYESILDNHGAQVDEALREWTTIPLAPQLDKYLNAESKKRKSWRRSAKRGE